MKAEELRLKLSGQDYICSTELARQLLISINTRPVGGAILYGPPGSGKSFLPQALAGCMGYDIVFFQCFPGMREEDLLVKLFPDPQEPSGVKALDGPVVQAAKNSLSGKKTVLVLDEWDKTRPSADAFLLDFLQTGRIWSGNTRIQANLDNILVFLTSNEERDIAEPLRRRLPRLDVEMPHPELIREALERSHPGHPYIPAAVMLYARGIKAGLTKPITVQELRQLLDAIDLLQEEADWDELVYTIVTKSPADHYLLKEAEKEEIDYCSYIPDRDKVRLDPTAYEPDETDFGKPIEEEKEEKVPKLPRPAIAGKMEKEIEPEESIDAPETDKYGIIEHNEIAYHTIVDVFGTEPGDTPDKLPETARVVKWDNRKVILLEKPLYIDFESGEIVSKLEKLCKIQEDAKNFLGDEKAKYLNGEIALVGPDITRETLMEAIKEKNRSNSNHRKIIISSYSKNEILFRDMATEPCFIGRWTPEEGLQILAKADRDSLSTLKDFIGDHLGETVKKHREKEEQKRLTQAIAQRFRNIKPRPYEGAKKLSLGAGLKAIVRVKLGDIDTEGTPKWEATVFVYLPAKMEGSESLHPFLYEKIGKLEEIKVVDGSLDKYFWGTTGAVTIDGVPYCYRAKTFSAPTQSEACSIAWHYGLSEVAKIQKAYRKMREKLFAGTDVNEEIFKEIFHLNNTGRPGKGGSLNV